MNFMCTNLCIKTIYNINNKNNKNDYKYFLST